MKFNMIELELKEMYLGEKMTPAIKYASPRRGKKNKRFILLDFIANLLGTIFDFIIMGLQIIWPAFITIPLAYGFTHLILSGFIFTAFDFGLIFVVTSFILTSVGIALNWKRIFGWFILRKHLVFRDVFFLFWLLCTIHYLNNVYLF